MPHTVDPSLFISYYLTGYFYTIFIYFDAFFSLKELEGNMWTDLTEPNPKPKR